MISDQHRIAFYADTHYASDGSTEYWTPPERLDVEAILLGGDNHCTPQRLAGMIAAIRATQRDETPIVELERARSAGTEHTATRSPSARGITAPDPRKPLLP